MKLTKEVKERIVFDINEKYAHEDVEFLDEEFVFVHTTDSGNRYDIYPLLGHVCGSTYTGLSSLKFLKYDGLEECECNINVYPKQYRAIHRLQHLNI